MKNITTLILLLGLIVTQTAMAIPAKPVRKTITQPDGTQLTIVLQGDEHFSYYATTDLVMLAKDKDGYMRYAIPGNNNEFVPGRYIARNPGERSQEVKTYLKETVEKKIADMPALRRDSKSPAGMPGAIGSSQFPSKGKVKGLIIMADFQDQKFSEVGSKEEITKMMNEEGYSNYRATGSARDYFMAQSNNTFLPEFDVVGPVSLPQDMEFYGKRVGNTVDQNPAQMIVDACNEAKKEYNVDFSQYDLDDDGIVDLVYVMYAGYAEAQGAPSYTVWPHAWDIAYAGLSLNLDGKAIRYYACSSELRNSSGTELDGIGSFCHEFSHCLGLPDLYDSQGRNGYGMGYWSIMDQGCYNNDSRTPPNYSAFERYSVSWLEPDYIDEPQQNVTLESIDQSNKAYFIRNDLNENEYFVLENRQNEGWDTYLPGHGLMITHVNYNPAYWVSNTVNSPKGQERVQIVPADNILSLKTGEADAFPGTTGNDAFTDLSTPEAALADGSSLAKPVTRIRETDGVISFNFKDYLAVRPLLKNATAIKENGFMARWSTMENISSYTLEVAPLTTGQPLLKEEPVTAPGWTEKTGSNRTVISPRIDLMNNQTFTLCIELDGTEVPSSTLELAWYEREESDESFARTSFEVTSQKIYWTFEADEAAGFLKLTADEKVGLKNVSLYTGDVKDELENNSLPSFPEGEQKQILSDIRLAYYKVNGLQPGSTYIYSVSTVIDGANSIPSLKKTIVTEGTSGIQNTDGTVSQVYVSGNRLTITSCKGESIGLYTIDGILKDSFKATGETESLQVENGIYIVRIGTGSYKVTVMQ